MKAHRFLLDSGVAAEKSWFGSWRTQPAQPDLCSPITVPSPFPVFHHRFPLWLSHQQAVSTGKGTPLHTHSWMQREKGSAPPEPSPATHRSPSPMGRALLLTGDFQGAVELPPEPLQSGHCLQEKGSSLLGGRDGRAEVSTEATEVSTEATALMAASWRPWLCPGLTLCHRQSL